MQVEIQPSLDAVAPAEWDALAGDDHPFLEHSFLALLERSKSVCASAGWAPAHILVRDGSRLIGAAPTYVRGDSYGEYIFDWAWADAAARAGLSYYPKITVAIPFTPATGPRLLVHPEADRDETRRALIAGLQALRDEVNASGVHVLFCQDEEADFLNKNGFSRRATHQFHWRNDSYSGFDSGERSFLSMLRSSARKQIRKERKRSCAQGLSFETRRGNELGDEEWNALFRLYRSTSDRKWGSPYLTEAFFSAAGTTLGERAVAVLVKRGQEIVAGTLSFAKGKHLYGRYWGAFEELDCVHFEACYYQLLDLAIAEGYTLVEAGAQGPHKIKRGFLPVQTHSAHALHHPGLQHAIDNANQAEMAELRLQLEQIQHEGPFRADCIPPQAKIAGISL